jgi:hypothetical protein
MSVMTDAQKKRRRLAARRRDEHSLMLHLNQTWWRLTTSSAVGHWIDLRGKSAAAQKDWPGYIGAPR